VVRGMVLPSRGGAAPDVLGTMREGWALDSLDGELRSAVLVSEGRKRLGLQKREAEDYEDDFEDGEDASSGEYDDESFDPYEASTNSGTARPTSGYSLGPLPKMTPLQLQPNTNYEDVLRARSAGQLDPDRARAGALAQLVSFSNAASGLLESLGEAGPAVEAPAAVPEKETPVVASKESDELHSLRETVRKQRAQLKQQHQALVRVQREARALKVCCVLAHAPRFLHFLGAKRSPRSQGLRAGPLLARSRAIHSLSPGARRHPRPRLLAATVHACQSSSRCDRECSRRVLCVESFNVSHGHSPVPTFRPDQP
jgi:hypothetical protein